ncbi:MAG: transaldolase [Leptospiraceae bacterium]|nr:transaldolase [Leptospiraceae bacterium]
MNQNNELKIKIFADGANKSEMLEFAKNPFVNGFTTNPSLMKKAGITNYLEFAKDILSEIKTKPISFEVFADELKEMETQALKISSLGENVFVKIPITNSKGISTAPIIHSLSSKKVKLNITAVFTIEQTRDAVLAIEANTEAVISVFAGRLADVGIDPSSFVSGSVALATLKKNVGILWASTREVWNIFQAQALGCEVITAPKDVLTKLKSLGRDPKELSLETVQTFYKDALDSGFKLD